MSRKVMVIVVTFNGIRWLERCLGSVSADADLYVFDNGSTDGSADYVAEHFPVAKLVRSDENLGFSKPNNLGFLYAIEKGYDYVYLLNQDAWLEEGALEKLVAVAEANPGYAVLSPLQMSDDYKDMDYQFKKVLSSIKDEQSVLGSELMEVKRVMAAHWLVSVGVIKQIGPFEENLFPHWGQDDEWCNRLHFFGLKVGVVPEARAVHDRAWREESLERLVKRNYYTGSLVRLCDASRPLLGSLFYVIVFTLVKSLKYRSFLPVRYFRKIMLDIPRVRAHRTVLFMRRA